MSVILFGIDLLPVLISSKIKYSFAHVLAVTKAINLHSVLNFKTKGCSLIGSDCISSSVISLYFEAESTLE